MKTLLKTVAIALAITAIILCLDWLQPGASREKPAATNPNLKNPVAADTELAAMPELATYQQWPIIATEHFAYATAPSSAPPDASGRTAIEDQLWYLCIAPPLARSSHGPHFSPEIRVRVNDRAYANFANSATAPLPEKSVVVKEKFATADDNAPVALGVMIKREAGYDPEGGNWEYAYLNGPNFSQVIRGRLDNCRSCHASQAKADFLFRTHLNREQQK